MKKFDVIALGELLVDMSPGKESEGGNFTFEACPGGAPCNVLAVLAKEHFKTAFLGKVGDDFLGHMLAQRLEEFQIDTQGLLLDASVKTTLAFVHRKENGDRDFSFYRKPGADMMIRAEEVRTDLIADAKIFHFGTLSLTDSPAREATKAAIEAAKNANVMISFDPNLREPLWDDLQEARIQMLWGLQQCDILKISDNEVTFLTGERDMEQGFHKIQAMTTAKIIFVTLGKDGSFGWCGDQLIYAAGEHVENVVDTTGAGDTFLGSALQYIIEHDLTIGTKDLQELLQTANHNAAEVTKVKGALLSARN